MPRQPLFAGLVLDEFGKPAESALVGDEPCYVVDDAGFRRHIPSEQVDRQVLGQMAEMMKGSEEFLSEQTAKMLGQEDVFTVAAIEMYGTRAAPTRRISVSSLSRSTSPLNGCSEAASCASSMMTSWNVPPASS